VGTAARRTSAGGRSVPSDPCFEADTPGDIVGEQGWGVSASGRWPSPFWRARDLVLFQVNRGAGIGHYVTDLNSAEERTASSTPPPTPFVRFTRFRIRQLRTLVERSTPFRLTSGLVDVTTLDIQPASGAAADVPLFGQRHFVADPSLELVTEFLFGIRVNKDMQPGGASQVQSQHVRF